MRANSFGAFCAALMLLGSTAAPAEHDERLNVADYLEYERVADAQISPDGRRVIYTRRWVNRLEDRLASALWIMDADGSRQRFLVEGDHARWSPSGDRIAFIAKGDNGKPQIFVRWMSGEGSVSQVTRLDEAPSFPTWSPDGQRIAFLSSVPANDSWAIDLPPQPAGANWSKPPRILDQLHYRQDRVGFRQAGYSHLFVVPAHGGTAEQLTHGQWNVGARLDVLDKGGQVDWTPDGKMIVFDGWQESDGDLVYGRSNIHAIDVASKQIRQLTSEPGFWHTPVVSHDGKRIAYLGYAATRSSYSMPRLHVMDGSGANHRQLSESFDRPATRPFWATDDRGIYFTAENQGYLTVFFMDLRGSVRVVTPGQQSMRLQSVNRATNVGVGVRSSYHEPGDVHSFALNGRGESRRLTAVNSDLLDGIELGQQEEIWYQASDGSRAHGWIIKPPGFDPRKKYPLLLEIHGGPFLMYVGDFDFQFQVYAANDFVVLYTNPRGSTGYGEAYARGIDHAYPGVDYLDLMGGVDAVVGRGYIDEKRLYVGGCSGGGVLSSWIIAHTQRFAAATVRCPITNWMSAAGTSDLPHFAYSLFQRPFWEDPSDWLERSPLMHVGNVRTPTAIMTGELDARTPIAQSEEYFAALKLLGVPARLVRFNDEYHVTSSRPSNYMRTMLYVMSWYRKFTLDGRIEQRRESE